MNWRKSMFAIPRLCAVVLLKWSEAGVYVHSPCLGVLLVVDVELFRSSVCDLVEVRLCFLENNHILRAHHTARHFALSKNLHSSSRLRGASLSPSPPCLALIPSNGLMFFICLYLVSQLSRVPV